MTRQQRRHALVDAVEIRDTTTKNDDIRIKKIDRHRAGAGEAVHITVECTDGGEVTRCRGFFYPAVL